MFTTESLPRRVKFFALKVARHGLFQSASLALCILLVVHTVSCSSGGPQESSDLKAAISYYNHRILDAPWSVHVLRFDRGNSEFALHSTIAQGTVLGMDTLTDQINAMKPEWGTPLAAVNGDFYTRNKDYAGDPRGLQIVDGELISGPIGGVSFWIDSAGQPRATNVASQFKVTWPNGATTPIGLNEERRTNTVVLYTPALGESTRANGGRELVLERAGPGSPWLPLSVGETYSARVQEVREEGDTPLNTNILVLSLCTNLLESLPKVEAGAVLKISTGTMPGLKGAKTAISGGPMLVRGGRQLKLDKPNGDAPLPYEFRSMWERHPRTALGWNKKYFYLVQVDGRQKKLSVGMTLEELAKCMSGLGCTEVMNLDGGGSAVFWFDGRVANSPCDGRERDIANALVVTRKEKEPEPPKPSTDSIPAGEVKPAEPPKTSGEAKPASETKAAN